MEKKYVALTLNERGINILVDFLKMNHRDFKSLNLSYYIDHVSMKATDCKPFTLDASHIEGAYYELPSEESINGTPQTINFHVNDFKIEEYNEED